MRGGQTSLLLDMHFTKYPTATLPSNCNASTSQTVMILDEARRDVDETISTISMTQLIGTRAKGGGNTRIG